MAGGFDHEFLRQLAMVKRIRAEQEHARRIDEFRMLERGRVESEAIERVRAEDRMIQRLRWEDALARFVREHEGVLGRIGQLLESGGVGQAVEGAMQWAEGVRRLGELSMDLGVAAGAPNVGYLARLTTESLVPILAEQGEVPFDLLQSELVHSLGDLDWGQPTPVSPEQVALASMAAIERAAPWYTVRPEFIFQLLLVVVAALLMYVVDGVESDRLDRIEEAVADAERETKGVREVMSQILELEMAPTHLASRAMPLRESLDVNSSSSRVLAAQAPVSILSIDGPWALVLHREQNTEELLRGWVELEHLRPIGLVREENGGQVSDSAR